MMLDVTMARSASLMVCALVLVVAFAGVLWAHWQHRQRVQTHFHATTLGEMSWSLAPVLMVLTLVGFAFRNFWLV